MSRSNFDRQTIQSIFSAARRSDTELFKKLVEEHGSAILNIQNSEGASPILWVCHTQNMELLEYVLNKEGVIIDHGNTKRTFSPLETLWDKNNEKALKMVLAKEEYYNEETKEQIRKFFCESNILFDLERKKFYRANSPIYKQELERKQLEEKEKRDSVESTSTTIRDSLSSTDIQRASDLSSNISSLTTALQADNVDRYLLFYEKCQKEVEIMKPGDRGKYPEGDDLTSIRIKGADGNMLDKNILVNFNYEINKLNSVTYKNNSSQRQKVFETLASKLEQFQVLSLNKEAFICYYEALKINKEITGNDRNEDLMAKLDSCIKKIEESKEVNSDVPSAARVNRSLERGRRSRGYSRMVREDKESNDNCVVM